MADSGVEKSISGLVRRRMIILVSPYPFATVSPALWELTGLTGPQMCSIEEELGRSLHRHRHLHGRFPFHPSLQGRLARNLETYGAVEPQRKARIALVHYCVLFLKYLGHTILLQVLRGSYYVSPSLCRGTE